MYTGGNSALAPIVPQEILKAFDNVVQHEQGTLRYHAKAQLPKYARERCTVIDSYQRPSGMTREAERHPWRYRCTLHTKKWTKHRIEYYATQFKQAIDIKHARMKSKTTTATKKGFLHNIVNLFSHA